MPVMKCGFGTCIFAHSGNLDSIEKKISRNTYSPKLANKLIIFTLF